jgi:hypothetical protein
MAINYNNNNQGIGTLDLSEYGLIQPDNNINNQQANWINKLSGGMFGTTDEQDAQNAALKQIQGLRNKEQTINALGEGAQYLKQDELKSIQDQIQQIKNQYKGVDAIDQASLVNEYGYPLMASLSGAVPNRVSAIDQMANYDWSNFDTNIAKNMALANKMNTTLDNTLTEDIDIDSLRNPFAPLENEFNVHGGDWERGWLNRSLRPGTQEYRDAEREDPEIEKSKWEQFTDSLGSAKDSLGRRAKKAGKIPIGILGALANTRNPLNPNSKNFNPMLASQMETYGDQGWEINDMGQALSGPLAGQNIVSGFGTVDVPAMLRKRLQKIRTRKIAQTASSRKKQADILKDIAAQVAAENKGYTGTPGGNVGSGVFAKFDQSGKTYGPYSGQGGNQGSNKGSSGGVKTGAGRNPWGRRDGGRVGYANGGLASLFTRRG